MPEIICKECGKRMYHENETTLKLEETVHQNFCRKKEGEIHSFMHKDVSHQETFDSEREFDHNNKPVLKK